MVPPLKEDDDYEIFAGTDASTSANVPSESSTSAMTGVKANTSLFPQVKFSHVQIYADSLDDLTVYKKLENDLCEFSALLERQENKTMDRMGKRHLWQSIVSQRPIEFEKFLPQNRDVIKQLMVGFGMRVTACHRGCGTKSFLVTTRDLGGIQILVTAKDSSDGASCGDADGHNIHHFDMGTSQTSSWR
jgi:hypothetical protein